MITKEQYQKALDDLNNSGSHGNGTTHLHIYTNSLNAIQSSLRAQIEAPADDELVKENTRLKYDMKLLASEMVYNGNSVSHWYAKAKAYKAAVGRMCDVATKHGIKIDGKTDVVDWIDAHLGAATKPAAPLWQTIDSAPRDGTHILVFCADSGCMAVAYYQHNKWDVTCYGGWESEPSVYPAHWQPLPQPPQAEG